MKRTLLLVFVVATLAATALPAFGITRGGELDGDDHPYVGLMVADVNGVPQWRCSGSLIAPTLYVTAGHCTFGADSATIWFASDVAAERPENGYPFGDTGFSVNGTPYSHPLYVDEAFYLYDLGVVVLDEPMFLSEYAELPVAGVVDTLEPGRKSATVRAVGYGLQAVKPTLQADLVRYQAGLFVVDTKGVAGIGNIDLGPLPPTNSMIVSGDAKHGGTCFGDSGGPMLLEGTNVIVGVNSFGLNSNCAGIGGAFRIDRDVELNWISSFLP
jgi:hypothetical protein